MVYHLKAKERLMVEAVNLQAEMVDQSSRFSMRAAAAFLSRAAMASARTAIWPFQAVSSASRVMALPFKFPYPAPADAKVALASASSFARSSLPLVRVALEVARLDLRAALSESMAAVTEAKEAAAPSAAASAALIKSACS